MKSVKKILVLIVLLAVKSAYGLTVVEDAEDTTTSKWKVRVGSADDITNVYIIKLLVLNIKNII